MCTWEWRVDTPPGCLARGLPPRACLPHHGVYPRIAMLVTCLGTRVADSFVMIAGSWERHLRWLHTERGPWWLCLLPSAPPRGTAQWSLVLSISRSSPAPHLRHSGTRASLGCGSNLAPLGRSLALVHRFALSTLFVPSSPCRDTAFCPMELLPLPVWLVSCGTPFLGYSDAPSGGHSVTDLMTGRCSV